MQRWMIGMVAIGLSASPAMSQQEGSVNAKDRPGAAQAQPTAAAAAPRGLPGAAPGGAPAATPAPQPTPAVKFRLAGKREKVTHLGVGVSPAAAALREQLKLAHGVGLVVDSIEAKGPAEVAGVKEYDVVEKLDDQLLVNPEQLTALVRAMKPGDDVTLSIVRQGARQQLKAKLIEKEVEVGLAADGRNAAFFNAAVPPPQLGGAPQAWHPAIAPLFTVAADQVIVREVDGKQTTEWSDGKVAIALERDEAEKDYVIKPNDLVGIAITDVAGPKIDATKSTRVGEDGTVNLPLIGNLKAAGLTKAALEKAIAQTYRDKNIIQDARVTVTVPGATVGVTITDKRTGKELFRGQPGEMEDLFQQRPDLRRKYEQARTAEAQPVRIDLRGDVRLEAIDALPSPMSAARGKVLRWQDDDHLLLMRALGDAPTYLLALSKKDGKVLYDGPVMTPEQRKDVPADVATKFEAVKSKPGAATEFGAPAKVTTPATPAVERKN